jgi:hypothetical protein
MLPYCCIQSIYLRNEFRYLLKLQSTVWESFNYLTTAIIPTETTLSKTVSLSQNAEIPT